MTISEKKQSLLQLKYKFGEIFFLKMFPKGKKKVEDSQNSLVKRHFKMIEQRFISNFMYKPFFASKVD